MITLAYIHASVCTHYFCFAFFYLGDEVVIIQEKLDGIKSRYSEITKLSSDVSKVLEQALNLATQFHSTHDNLGKWLDKVEVELKSYETQDQNPEEMNAVQQRKKVMPYFYFQ